MHEYFEQLPRCWQDPELKNQVTGKGKNMKGPEEAGAPCAHKMTG